MSRTVIRIESHVNADSHAKVTLRPQEPTDVSDFATTRELPLRAADAPFSDLAAAGPGDGAALPDELVRVVGEKLWAGLAAHAGVGQALDLARNAPPGAVHPILLASTASDVEALPFEVLYHPTVRFFGLDPRWPIVRVVGDGAGTLGRFVKPPLRLAVVLAAADRHVQAIGEWDALRTAIAKSQLPVEATVFVADAAVHQHVAAVSPGVDLRWVPDSTRELLDALKKLRPQLLHVFSHGSAKFTGFLEVANNRIKFGDPPLYVTAIDLTELRDLVWLVTLNACEGAAPAASLRSLAYSLVKGGVPAVIGMREPIDAADANLFCGAFYNSAFHSLAQALQPKASVAPDWNEALRAAREALCARHPGPPQHTAPTWKSWTLPVIYQRAERLVAQVLIPGLQLGDAEQEQVWSTILKLEELLAALPVQARPGIEALIADARARLV